MLADTRAGLYAMHRVAIACGWKPPFVEQDHRSAEQCFWAFVPSGVGLFLGAVARFALWAGRWPRHSSGPPMRIFPETAREVMVAVACVAVALGCLNRLIFPPTIYAAGYDEAEFQRVQEGMTEAEVIASLGEPIRKVAWSNGAENWWYCERYTRNSSGYHRRWIFVKNGRVLNTVGVFMVD